MLYYNSNIVQGVVFIKKQGFTLVELLAVIVILAVISLIAVPIILGIIDDANISAKKTSIDNYASALSFSVAQYQLNNNQSIYGSFQNSEGKLTNGKVILEVKYDGDVICDNIFITQEGLISISDCKVNGEYVDYSPELNIEVVVFKNKTTGVSHNYDTIKQALENIQANNIASSEIIIYGEQEIGMSDLKEFGGTNTTDINIIGGNKEAQIIITGNGYTRIDTMNENMIVTFKNIDIDSETTLSSSSAWEYLYTKFDGNFNFINVTFSHPIGLASDTSNYNFTNCHIVGHSSSKYGIWLYAGNAVFEGCTFTGYRALKMHDYSGFKGDVVINNCTFDSITTKPGVVVGDVVYGETTLKITNNTFINANVPGDQNNYTYESDSMAPTEYTNNIVNGVVENALRDTSSYDSWLASKQ